jgi:predicted small lipoprotein YifL
MATNFIRSILVGATALVVLAGCGAGGPATAPTATTAPRPSPTADLPQLKVDFEVLNHQEHDDLTSATATNMFQAQTLESATEALRIARDAYLAFDTGLQHLTFPTSMNGDVAAALHRDAQVEADYLSSIMSPTDVAQMQAAIAPASQILAGLATDTLRSDLGLPPAAQY